MGDVREVRVLLIRVPRNQQGRVTTGGTYLALIATKEEVLVDVKGKVFHREWVETQPFLKMETDYEEVFRKQLAKNICTLLKSERYVGKFKFEVLDKLLSGRDYDIPIRHLEMLLEKIHKGERV